MRQSGLSTNGTNTADGIHRSRTRNSLGREQANLAVVGNTSTCTDHVTQEAPRSENKPIRRLDFSTENLPPIRRFLAWKKMLAPMANMQPDPAYAIEEFNAQVMGYSIGEISASKSIVSPHLLIGHPKDQVENKAFPLFVNLYLDGGFTSHDGGSETMAGPGDIALLDPEKAFSIRIKASTVLSFAIPRQQIYGDEAMQPSPPGTRIISGDTIQGKMLGQLLQDIWAQIVSNDQLEMDVIERMLFANIRAALTIAAHDPESQVSFVTMDARQEMLQAIRDYIDNHLAESLNVQQISHKFNCSRSTLYRLFTPFGGVASYIRRARLNRCLEELMKAHEEPQSIAELGYRWEFADHSHFCRLFHEAYGATPSDVAHIGQLLYEVQQSEILSGTNIPVPNLACFQSESPSS